MSLKIALTTSWVKHCRAQYATQYEAKYHFIFFTFGWVLDHPTPEIGAVASSLTLLSRHMAKAQNSREIASCHAYTPPPPKPSPKLLEHQTFFWKTALIKLTEYCMFETINEFK